MTTKELIRAEIERMKKNSESAKMEWIDEGYTQNAFAEDCRIASFDKLLSFLDTLEKQERPEPYNPVYDEDYINEKIKKATESWKGVDVNKMLAECRGYDEPEVDLEEAAMNYIAPIENEDGLKVINFSGRDIKDAFIAGAEWQKEQMMKDAVNGMVISLTYRKGVEVATEQIDRQLEKYEDGDNVKIIVVKEEEQ